MSPVDCRHARPTDSPDAVRCLAGRFGGTPSAAVCRQACPGREPAGVRGLGDVVAAVLEWTGVAGLVKRRRGQCGGCEARRRAMNKAVPLGRRGGSKVG